MKLAWILSACVVLVLAMSTLLFRDSICETFAFFKKFLPLFLQNVALISRWKKKGKK
jgi:hypothetical protein